ncbi:haloacid dehalogenase type II [Sabulicella glaciei]|uniref:(S)-2-haloacid dehalogenase n=1 Tax=Sabulicella glaciei TaxID=2984948 RepID=A0ABT3NU15_9PROT|nr:haloacid dehalogenase type II [Roseococcus sp. MDT2-1-1]MCW8085373.1 haloacid dehalogenase type II [Roseococcus sp. MDT2-1-1]
MKALVFDVFGTVVDWRSGVARELAGYLSAIGRTDLDPFALADAWRRRYQPAMEECRSGRRPWTRLDVLHRENLETMLADHGITGADPQDLDALNLAWHRLDPWPDVLLGLHRLRRRFFLAPLSNGNIALLANMAKRARIPWDAVLGAEPVQAYKPQPEAYLRTAGLLAMRPDEVCLVAAHNGDLRAARKAGLKTAFVARPTEHGEDQAIDLAPEEDWDVVAKDFVELAAKLEA